MAPNRQVEEDLLLHPGIIVNRNSRTSGFWISFVEGVKNYTIESTPGRAQIECLWYPHGILIPYWRRFQDRCRECRILDLRYYLCPL